MLLTITTTHRPATDLGYLLHKNPSAVFTSEMPFGRVNVFYPEISEERCTAALLLEVDPIRLVRGRPDDRDGGLFDQYVNDRPYAASSFISSAITECYRTAMNGRSKDRQELADSEVLRSLQQALQRRTMQMPRRGWCEPPHVLHSHTEATAPVRGARDLGSRRAMQSERRKWEQNLACYYCLAADTFIA